MYYSIQLLYQIPPVIKQNMPYDDPSAIHTPSSNRGNEFGIFLNSPRDSYLKIGYPRPAEGRFKKIRKNKLPTSMLILEFNGPRQIHHRSCVLIIDCREYTRVFNTCQTRKEKN